MMRYVILVLVVAGAARADEFQLEMWAFQGLFNRPRASHTFAVMKWKVDGQLVEPPVTISWLPAPGNFGPFGGMPVGDVRGKNYDFRETLGLAGTYGRREALEGLYYTTPEFYRAFKDREADLGKGRIRYQMVDLAYPLVSNCIHALSGVVDFLPTPFAWGMRATEKVADFFMRTDHVFPAQPPRRRPPVIRRRR